MARNEEKQYGRLNRLHLQQQREEQLKKKPPRPRLHTLNTVSDVKKWLPSITRDIDFSLKNKPLEFIGQTNTDQNKPLQFIGQTPTDQDKPLQFTQLHRVTCHMKEVYSAAMSSRQDASQQSEEDEDMEIVEPSAFEGEQSLLPNGRVGTNPLGIDYESSSSS
ncbi:hypothetical protein LSAT2_013348 [Lamellibrachia satsuma]|nr:hypothetical protein LSAT2_013348 [Lamellibrachia satsuma]